MDATSFTDGNQGFEMARTNGLVVTTLDAVDLTGYTNTSVSMNLLLNNTNWDTHASFRAYVTVDGGQEIDLINTAGSDIDDLDIEGDWMAYAIDLSGYTTAQLSFATNSSGNGQCLLIDNVRFESSPVPVPGASILLFTGLCALAGARRVRS